MQLANRLYAVLGWALVTLGSFHMLATFWLTKSTPNGRVWFFGAGIAMALSGALNLLNRTYGPSAPGLLAVCRANNVLLTLFTIAAGIITTGSNLERVLIIGLVSGTLVLSLIGSALNTTPKLP